jgi:hypothetical protein
MSDTTNEKIETLKSQFFSALDDFKKYFVFYNKNPESDEYLRYYENAKSQLITISQDLFNTTKTVYDNIQSLESEMSDVSDEIDKNKETNEKMFLLTQELKKTESGSQILISDSKTEYNTLYNYNVQIFVGILLLSGSIVAIFKKP